MMGEAKGHVVVASYQRPVLYSTGDSMQRRHTAWKAYLDIPGAAHRRESVSFLVSSEAKLTMGGHGYGTKDRIDIIWLSALSYIS